ncbi:DNA recombination protein RmuC [Shimia abyssi]|uniref:DNA recombination protein RmuC homolog n=1 Tax=Shimia abyssi TaxID=1662395 RepID=A0A2P8F9W0_9RHOB|nr:DNA recombination protein RmuC [Shimia abyssi]PSL18499.1 DNA recombination protein RmuC [Shimia abyssi]
MTGDLWIWLLVVAGVVALALLVRLMGVTSRLSALRLEAAKLSEALSAEQTRAAKAEELATQVEAWRTRHTQEQAKRIEAEAQYRVLHEAHEARLEELRGMKKELEDKFDALASGVLRKNSESFLELVSERFKSHNQTATDDLDKRKLEIANLVKPLDEKLSVFDKKITEIEKSRTEAYGAINEQVQVLARGQLALGSETRKLVQALRAPKTRGRWGEMQLRQVFEMAGMAENVDFTLEHHMETDRGKMRPDAIVHIPGGKSIVVDAKTPLEAYLDALEAETPEAQAASMAQHARQVREHVKVLFSKAYQDEIATTPDFVVMFIPGETFVGAAAEADPGLIEFAFKNKVLIATPTTLMALVKAIAYGWQQEKMAENAVEVQRTAKELYDRLKTFGGHLSAVGRALNSSVSSYNKAVGSMEGRVLPSARKFEAMGVVTQDSELETPAMIESDTRPLSSLDVQDD